MNKVKEVNKVCKEKGETQARQELLDKRDPPVLLDPKDKGYTQSFLSPFFKNHIHMYSTLMRTVLVDNSEHQGNIWAWGEELAGGE